MGASSGMDVPEAVVMGSGKSEGNGTAMVVQLPQEWRWVNASGIPLNILIAILALFSSGMFRIMMIVMCFVGLSASLLKTLVTFRWRVEFQEDGIEARDWLGGKRRYGYGDIEEIIQHTNGIGLRMGEGRNMDLPDHLVWYYDVKRLVQSKRKELTVRRAGRLKFSFWRLSILSS